MQHKLKVKLNLCQINTKQLIHTDIRTMETVVLMISYEVSRILPIIWTKYSFGVVTGLQTEKHLR
jgi:hypothetical protein